MKRYTLLLALVVFLGGPSVPATANQGRDAEPDDGPAGGGTNAGAALTAQEAPALADSGPGEPAAGLANVGGEIRRESVSNAETSNPRGEVADRLRRTGLSTPPRIRPVPWYRSGLMSLMLVLAVIVGAVLLVRRLVPSVRRMSGGVVEILGRSHLSPKQSLALVRIGRRVLLVGVAPERLSTLCEIDEPQEVAELLGRSSRRLGDGPHFDELLSGAAAGFDESSQQAGELTSGPSDRLHRAKGQLRGLLSKLKSFEEQ